MVLLNALDLSLPLKNPVVIFSLVLFIILFAPILFNRIKVPHIIGLIIAGVIVGPYGLNLLNRDSSIVLFGTVGLLYIMFLAGLEIDIAEFKKNKKKILFFGLSVFVLPMVLGSLAGYYVLEYSFMSSLLLASMLSSHTLVSYPIASKYGISRNRAVTLTIGGTLITDILALFTLAAIAGMAKEETSSSFWVQLGVSSIVFVCIVFFVFPIITRWFFKNYEDSVSQYIFVLAMVFLASFLAEAAGLEPIIGAFFSGLVLNSFVPHSSPLMNRINFVGNAIFIPFFLISIGMLVDITVFTKGIGPLKVAAVIITVSVITRYLAALFTQKAFGLSGDERKLIHGLSSSHAAATLAIILVGYNIITGETATGEPIRLLGEDVLNGAILLILVSCTVSSFIVEKTSRKLALTDEGVADEHAADEKILVSLAAAETTNEMVDMAIMLKGGNKQTPIYGLHVTDDGSEGSKKQTEGRKILDKAVTQASATENILIPITRFDTNISNGIIYTIKEQNITDILIGIHSGAETDTLLGPKAESLLRRVFETIYIYKPTQPFNTLKRMVVAIPPRAEAEPGFVHWLNKLFSIAKGSGLSISFHATQETIAQLRTAISHSAGVLRAEFKEFSNWEDFLILGRELKANDLFVVISSRRNYLSFNNYLNKVPYYLEHYFKDSSFILLYPSQLEMGVNMEDIDQVDTQMIDALSEKIGDLGKAGNYIKRLFKKGE